MCTFEKDGVRFNGGQTISYLENIENISPELIADMNANKINGWSMFLLHRSMAEIKDEITHHHICPVNVDAIKKIVKDEIAKQPRIIWTKTKKIITLIIGILLSLTTIINFFVSVMNISK